MDKSDLKRVHKSVQNVIYNEMGLTREQVDERIDKIVEQRVDHWLETHNFEKVILDHVASAIKNDKFGNNWKNWNIRTMASIIEAKVTEVVREKVTAALKGMKIDLG